MPSSSWRRNSSISARSSSATSTSPSAMSCSPKPGRMRRNFIVGRLYPSGAGRHEQPGTAPRSGPGRRPGPARGRSRAGRRVPPRPRSRAPRAPPRAASGRAPGAPRAPTSGCSPSRARRRRGGARPAIRWMPSPSNRTSVASSRWPPVTTTTSGPRACSARASASTSSVAGVPGEHARLGEVRRDHASRAAAAGRPARARAASSSSTAPDSATITGSITTGVPGLEQVERLVDRGDGLRRPEHPDLHGVDADVLGDGADLLDDERPAAPGGRRSRRRVFCAVSAVIAVIPWTPQRANAFRSAWIPAPPPESEPAIESTAGDGRGHGAQGRTRARAGTRGHGRGSRART